jgi:hypothetical protein
LFVVCCLLFVVCCLLFVVCCLLFVVCCLLFVIYSFSLLRCRCQRCRHGGHLLHMMQWFETQTQCAVHGCSCSCHSFDKSAALVCLPAAHAAP